MVRCRGLCSFPRWAWRLIQRMERSRFDGQLCAWNLRLWVYHYPAPQKHDIQKRQNLGEFIFDPLHKFPVIHSASRNYTWTARFLLVIYGVGHYIETFWGKSFTVSLHKSYEMRSRSLHKIILRELLCNHFAEGCIAQLAVLFHVMPPKSAIGFRGKLFLQYPPPPFQGLSLDCERSCLRKEVGV